MFTFLVSTAMGHAGPMDDWTWRYPLPTEVFLSGVAYGNGQFLAVGKAGVVASSKDDLGYIWTQLQRATTVDLSGIAYGNGQFVAVGGSPRAAGRIGPQILPRLFPVS